MSKGRKCGCESTLMSLNVEDGAVDVYLCDQSKSNCRRYVDTIRANNVMFAYTLHVGDEQGFALVSALPEGSRATAFFYCFDITATDPAAQ